MARSDPWTRACEKFKEDLSDEEKRLFNTASPENLLAGTLLSYQTHEANSKSFRVVKALEPFVSIVCDYGAALDVLANTYSLVLSPLWGGLRIVLRIAEEAGKFFDKLVEMFGRIADILPRFEVYERLFSNHDRLVDMISTVYLDILTFCIDAKATFRKKGSVFKHLCWRPFQLRFQVSLVSMRNHVKSVEKEAMVSHMIESSEERSLMKQDETRRKEMIKADKKARYLTSLSSIAYEKIHRRASKLRHPGSCAWLLGTDHYQEWISSATSATLAVVGNPGCGKTVLASSLIDEFAHGGISGRPVLYYYCDYTDLVSLAFHSIVGTLLKELLLYMKTPPPSIQTQIDQLSTFDSQIPSEMGLLTLLETAVNRFDEIVVILDAIDECDQETQTDVVKLVRHFHSARDTTVRCIVFSREEAKLTSGFQAYPALKISPTTVFRDISAFVQDSVAERVESGELVPRSAKLMELIKSTLIEGANGMFLWVRLQLDELCEASSDKEIRRILRNLPEGLTEIYKRILRKINASTLKSKMARKIFWWLSCAKRTLELSELVEAIAFSSTDKCWNADSIPDESRALQACRSLVVLDEETQQVRFVHHTVGQLLVSWELRRDHDLKDFSFVPAQAHGCLTQVLYAYLCFSDFETQLTRVDTETQIQGPDLVRTQGTLMQMPHEMPLGTLLVSAWKMFRGLRTRYEVPTIKFPDIAITKQKTLPMFFEKYRLLDYAIQHWLSHTTEASFLFNHVSRIDFESLVFDKKLPFGFRPWGDNGGPRDFPHMPLFRWAVKNGHGGLLSLVGFRESRKLATKPGSHSATLRRYCIEEIDNHRSPLLWAVENDLLELLNAFEDTTIRSFAPHTPRQLLCAAARQPFSEVLTWVMEKTQGHVDANDLLAALLAAVENQHDAATLTVTRLTAAAVQTLIITTRSFEPNARPKLLLGLSTISFCKILDWALNDYPSNSLVAVLTTHVLVPSLALSENIFNYPHVFVWAVESNKVEFMRHFMRALPIETISKAEFWEAAESVAASNDQESEVVKIMWSYLQPIDPAKYFNGQRQPALPQGGKRSALSRASVSWL